jgi:hypothetical protein
MPVIGFPSPHSLLPSASHRRPSRPAKNWGRAATSGVPDAPLGARLRPRSHLSSAAACETGDRSRNRHRPLLEPLIIASMVFLDLPPQGAASHALPEICAMRSVDGLVMSGGFYLSWLAAFKFASSNEMIPTLEIFRTTLRISPSSRLVKSSEHGSPNCVNKHKVISVLGAAGSRVRKGAVTHRRGTAAELFRCSPACSAPMNQQMQ